MAELATEYLLVDSAEQRVYVMRPDYSGFDLTRFEQFQLQQWQRVVYPDYDE